ncbi:LOC100909712 [Phodopus roborovskii]|uniref:LOC100909712 protein n=1 Tax=Phodopus roborovskii TaxID=109678 RepID=A0AAU9ZYK4_PHORO|nr:LOC100909712 [Phodopus roborovskii]
MASGPHPTSTAAAASASSAAPSAGGSSSGTTTTTTTTTGGILIGDRLYSEVSLTIDHSLIPEERLSPTPSMQDGLDLPSETDLRILGCELIQAAGILLRLPQVAMATGQVLFHRFFYSKSFVKHSFEIVAMACINLASKIEEAPRRIRDVINVFHHLRQLRGKRELHLWTILAVLWSQSPGLRLNKKGSTVGSSGSVFCKLFFPSLLWKTEGWT